MGGSRLEDGKSLAPGWVSGCLRVFFRRPALERVVRSVRLWGVSGSRRSAPSSRSRAERAEAVFRLGRVSSPLGESRVPPALARPRPTRMQPAPETQDPHNDQPLHPPRPTETNQDPKLKPEQTNIQTQTQNLFPVGTVLWAKLQGYPAWPAKVIRRQDKLPDHGYATVYFFKSGDTSRLKHSLLVPWDKGAEQGWLEKFSVKKSSKKLLQEYPEAVRQAQEEIRNPTAEESSDDENESGSGYESSSSEGAQEEGDDDKDADDASSSDGMGDLSSVDNDDAADTDFGKGGDALAPDSSDDEFAHKDPNEISKKRKSKKISAAAARAAAGEPKRAASAYILFASSKRPQVKEENPSASMTELGKLLGTMWRDMDAEAKAEWGKKQDEDKERYEKELSAYIAEHGETIAQKQKREKDEQKAAVKAEKRAASEKQRAERKAVRKSESRRKSSGDESMARRKSGQKAVVDERLELLARELAQASERAAELETRAAKTAKTFGKVAPKRTAALEAGDEKLVSQIDELEPQLRKEKEDAQKSLSSARARIEELLRRIEAHKKAREAVLKQEQSRKVLEKKARRADYAPQTQEEKGGRVEERGPRKAEEGQRLVDRDSSSSAPRPSRSDGSSLKRLRDADGVSGDNTIASKAPRNEQQLQDTDGDRVRELSSIVERLMTSSESGRMAELEDGIEKLENFHMTLELLQKVGTAVKAVKLARKANPLLDTRARSLTERWKAMVQAA